MLVRARTSARARADTPACAHPHSRSRLIPPARPPLLVHIHLLLHLIVLQRHVAWGFGAGPHDEGCDALDDGEQHAANHGVATRSLPPTPRGEHAAGQEPGGDLVPMV